MTDLNEGGDSVEVLVLTANFEQNEDGEWCDDWGGFFKIRPLQCWWVARNRLIPAPKPDPLDKHRSPVQIRCKKLWNESKWVKNNPAQAYK